jgi:Leucine-rich repeat (LRR) protein
MLRNCLFLIVLLIRFSSTLQLASSPQLMIKLTRSKLDSTQLREDITSLNLANRRINDLETDIFHNFSKLEKLTLNNNRLSSFYSKLVLNGLNDLKVLILSHNRIKCIDEFPFSSVPNLTILDLSNNRINIVI